MTRFPKPPERPHGPVAWRPGAALAALALFAAVPAVASASTVNVVVTTDRTLDCKMDLPDQSDLRFLPFRVQGARFDADDCDLAAESQTGVAGHCKPRDTDDLTRPEFRSDARAAIDDECNVLVEVAL